MAAKTKALGKKPGGLSDRASDVVLVVLSVVIMLLVAYPLYYTAHSSLVALSTRNSNDRGLLSTFSNASGVAAVGIGASILVPMLLQNFLFVPNADGSINADASYANWRVVMVVLCVITAIGILIEYYFSRERITEESLKMPVEEKKIPMSKQIKVCMSNKYWWIIILYFLLFQLGGLVKNGSMNYYCTWVFEGIDSGTAMGLLGAIGGIPTAIGMVLAWPIAIFILGTPSAPFAYVVPFMTAALVGVVIASVLMFLMNRSGALNAMRRLAGGN